MRTKNARTPTNRILSYVVTHDHGFAPNPFGGYLTLATCKPVVRRNARLGDWIVGTGSVRGVGSNHLVYAAQVKEILRIEEYAEDPRFRMKIPRSSGREWARHGDNIYRRDAEGWHRHRNPYHMTAQQMAKDLRGRNVLIYGKFWYFGQRAPRLPDDLLGLGKKGPGHKLTDDPGVAHALQDFLSRFPLGIAHSARKDVQLGSKGRCSPGCPETVNL